MSCFSLFLRRLVSVLLALSLIPLPGAAAQEADPEESREVAIIGRFITVLEKNPRRGTALDKVYGHHVERGSLDALIKTYRDKGASAKGIEAGSAWMIVGLLESLRGQDAESVQAFAKAEELDPANYLASYYLGQALVLVGQPDKAAEALERAISRKPAQADQLDIFQSLGRVYQRAQKTAQALEVWNRLEKQFPNDARVQEQIAATLLEENEFAAALPRFENLARTTKDKYRQSLFQMEAAEIKVRLGKSAEAIKEFETLLGQLNPENWLFREVRRRIENVFLRTDDQAGLIAYYEAWTKKNPEDLEAISRLSRLLSGLGRGPEAQAWLQKGLKVAPTRKELRSTLIAQLLYDQKYAEAIAQYEQLDKHEPNNPDTLRDWGRLILKDPKRDEATRKKDAAAVWRRLTIAKPKDPLIASQVAELFRHAEMVDEALAMYRQAIDLAPADAQYKEYLGEFFHSLNRKDEALATWRQMAEGPARTAPNLSRLAEVLTGFGYLPEAVEANRAACQLDPKDINLQIKQSDLLAQAEQSAAALQQLEVVKKLAASDEEREAWLQRELRLLQNLDQLKARIAATQKELSGLPAATTDKQKLAQSEQWYWLARACEAERQLKEAAEAATRAGELAPQSIPILMSSARILEAQNNLLGAVEINTRLAAVDRRYRTEYLKKIAQLEVALGRRDKAIQAGRDLLAAAPGNPELYEFFSQLCFQLGENEEGLQALRRSVRVNPTEPKGLLLLASALGEQFRTGESIELYWRAFEKAGNLEDRLSVVPRLTELYLQTNQFDRLLERLERQRREPNQQREMTICLAQAYQSAGDDGNARQELEKLLTDETRDTQLLQQLVKLCEQDGDLESAIRFQQQLGKLAPGKDMTMRLAQLLMKSGETEEATALVSQATADEKDPEQLIKSIDSLLTSRNFEQVLGITGRLIREQPRNWELLYREGVALASSQPGEAARRFQAILDLSEKDDEQSLLVKNSVKRAKGRPAVVPASPIQANPLVQRSQLSYQIRQVVGMDRDDYMVLGGGQQQRQPFWSPHDFGAARMASLAWLNMFARKDGREDDFVQQWRAKSENPSDRRGILDFYYLASFRNDYKDEYEILKTLSRQPDADFGIKSLYLMSIANREGPQPASEEEELEGEDKSKLEPLNKDELDHVLKLFRERDNSALFTNYGEWFLDLVVAELKRADRKDEADAMLQAAFEEAKSPLQISVMLSGTIQRGDYDGAIKLLDRLAQFKPEPVTGQAVTNYNQYVATIEYQSQILLQLMAQRAKKKEIKDVAALWDRYLALAAARYQADTSTVAAKRKKASSNQYGQPGSYYLWRGNSQFHEQLDFPLANPVYDHNSIQLLRQAFVVYKDADNVAELLNHFQQKVAAKTESAAQQLFWKLGLGYLSWWNDDKEEALAVLTEVAQSMPGDEEMTFELARLHERRGDPQQALILIESMAAADQQTMQKREIAALRTSVNSGNIDRARIAAERLFGLRLDSNLQIQLARQMHQLGMHEQAEAVLARAGRQAGNKTDVLMNLMQQYQSQGKNDIATQIAYQLLRRSTGTQARNQTLGSMHPPGLYAGDDGGARQQALQVLKRSGKLPEMIKKVEEQRKHSPRSQKLLETLIEYYTADGNDKKAQELSAKFVETKGDDPQFRYQLGLQLMRAGKHKESVEHFKAALTKDPRLMRNSSWEIINAFENADKMDELASIFEQIDLSHFRQNSHELANLIGNLSRREKSKERAMTLFKKAWKALPDERSSLLSSMHNDQFWKMPEVYEYAREGIIPTESSLRRSGSWTGFGNIQSWGGDGMMTTLLSRFLTMAAQNKKLDELAAEVEQARGKLKNWQAGEPLLALINLRRGRVDEARTTFEKLLPKMKSVQQVGHYTHWEIAQELAAVDTCVDLAIQYLEAAVKDPDIMSGNEFTYTPGKALVMLYQRKGRKEDARRLIMQAINNKHQENYGNPQYEAYQRIQNAIALGNEIRQLGFPVDAIRVFQEALANPADLVAAKQYGSQLGEELQSGLRESLAALKPETLPELIIGRSDATDPNDQPQLDLLLIVESRDLDKTTISSALLALMTNLARKPEVTTSLRQAIQEARTRRPDDIGVGIISFQLALSTGDLAGADEHLKQMVELIQRVPLEPQPQKGGFTSKQREAALRQTALWVLARNCLQQESLRESGNKIAERALDASRRLSDQGYSLAILREWGQINLDLGDRQAAEAQWMQMLDIIIPKPADKAPAKPDGKTSSLHRDQPVVVGSAGRYLSRREQLLAPSLLGQVTFTVPLPASGQAPNAGGTKGSAVTLAQFEQAAQVAQLAAQNGLNELSMKALSQSLHAGPPIESIQMPDAGASGFPTIAQPQSSDQSPVLQKVVERLVHIEGLWRRKGVDEATIYQFLKRVVLPENRPLEVFLYPRPLRATLDRTPQSVGLLLVQSAVRARKTEDLRQAVATRVKQPLGELPARILTTQLALATGDKAIAREQIDLLDQRLKQDSLQYASELACHVAIPALKFADLPGSVSLLERAVEHFNQNSQQGRSGAQEEPMRTLRFTLARIHLQHGRVAESKKHLDSYLNFMLPLYRRSGVDYGQHRRRQELLKLSAEFARAGFIDEALECLGQHADLPLTRNYAYEGPGRAGALIFSALAELPAADRYQALKKWTLPTADRQSIRLVAGFVPADKSPAAFDALRAGTPRGWRQSRLVSTAELLLSAAQQAGTLKELRSEIQVHADKNVENARFLLLMTQIALGEGARVSEGLNQYLEERRKSLPNQGDYLKRPPLIDAVLARAAFTDPGLREVGRQLEVNFFLHCSRVQEHLLMAHSRREYNGNVIGNELSARLDGSPFQTGLKHWTASSLAPARFDAAGAAPMWWVAYDGLVTHVCGPDQSHLYFKYPLSGTFELSCEGWMGGWSEANTGFAGTAFVGLNGGNDTTVFPIGNRYDELHKPDPPEKGEHFNKMTLKVDPEKIQYFVNGALIHTQAQTESTSPWFFLHCDRVWQTCFRNLQIRGEPVIPAEVRLSQKESLLGWCSSFYGESQPVLHATNSRTVAEASAEYDWQSRDGVILGRLIPTVGYDTPPVQQSRLYYDRPLLDGDRLKYEFWYEAGAGGTHVHPAFDRLAVLLEEDGVKLHWMTDGLGLEDANAGLAPDNVLVDRSIQRGKVVLKPQDWNTIEIELKGGVATIHLNGTVVCERPLEPDNSRQFGLYHDKHATSVKVRNVVMTGDWPKSLSNKVLADLTAPARDRTPEERQILSNVIEEKFRATDIDLILQQTRAMNPHERYETLRRWVLPNEEHGTLRIYGDMSPADPVPVAPLVLGPLDLLGTDPSAVKGKTPAARRQRVSGDLISPALDLVAVASELGKLEELISLVQQAPTQPEQVRRSRLAMLVVTHIAARDFKQADQVLKELTPTRANGLPDALPIVERWPELIAAWEATRVPELRPSAVALLEVIVDSINRKGIGAPWEIKARAARQRARLLLEEGGDLPPVAGMSPRGQWAQSTFAKASSRAGGIAPRWRFNGTETRHVGGEGNDLLYFQSPLRGSFSVEAELSGTGWRETRLMYAGQWSAPHYTFESADIGNLYTNWVGPKFATRMDPIGEWYRARIDVTPEKISYYANDRLMHEATLSEQSDPWLAIHSFGHYGGGTRSIRILGQPEIPAELALSKHEELHGWWADTYSDPMNGDGAVWKKVGNEIVGQKVAAWEGRHRESLLQYHRPMFEDGEISYDFFCVPGQTEVHPALGRMALLLTSEGVKIHWLTDAQFERTGLALDNLSVEPQFRKGTGPLPLKNNDWNQISLQLKQDTLLLVLNGTVVYERPVEATNPRTFGLFRYAGDTSVRVKNVVYRGDWPRALPSMKDQELAGNDLELATFKPGELPASFVWNFQTPKPQHLDLAGDFPTTIRTPVEGGLRISREPNPVAESQSAGYQWPGVSISGDFEVTLGYRDFKSNTRNMNHQVPRVEIILALGGGFGQHTQTVALTHRRHQNDSMTLTSIHGVRRQPPAEDWQSTDRPLIADAGRIRIVRRDAYAYYLHAKAGSENWELLERRPVTTVDVKDLLIGFRSEDLNASGSVVLTEFSVRAKNLLYAPRFTEEELPTQVEWDFLAPQPKGLQAWGRQAPNLFEPAADGLLIRRPDDPKQTAAPVGFSWQGNLKGDFEMTLGFRDFESKTDRTNWEAPRIEIHIPIVGRQDPPVITHIATIGHRQKIDGSQFLITGLGLHQESGQYSWNTNEVKVDRTSGRLRLIRIGSMIYALAAPAGSDAFFPIASRVATEANVTSISFTMRSESKAPCSVKFTELSIRAKELSSEAVAATNAPKVVPGPSPFGDNDLPDRRTWNFQGARPDFLVEWGTKTAKTVIPVSRGLKVLRLPKPADGQVGNGYIINGSLTGDFEITLDYDDFQSQPVLADWQVPRIDISGKIADDVNPDQPFQVLGIAHRRLPKDELRIEATQGDRGPNKNISNYRATNLPTDRVSGRLRLVRQGRTMFYQSAPPGTETWQTITRLTVDDSPFKDIILGLRAEDLEGSGEAVLTNLTVRAEKFIAK
jgi:tetratricopeptide (TPR) repeat protein